MSSDASNDSLYLDSNVALAQRMQSESEVELNEATHQDEGQKGVLAGIKHRFNVMAPGGSISEFGNNVSSAAQEQVVAAKETLLEGAVPAAQGAMRTVQDQMCTIAGGATESKETVSEDRSQEESECIDNLSNEQICDFLREKHMSNRHPRPSK
ncbi:hypothetical protein Pdw03_2673 [Penicillium digitatum]|uniref:Uncharacterized protein n=1 Tax=Penicillium digitatum TaxID=36651 RepID=A0A7T6XET5_PENDI|nr:hypothetical protein Pdw03_2673 [Penicillium digitatum]